MSTTGTFFPWGQCAGICHSWNGHCWILQSFQPLSETLHHSLQIRSPREKGLIGQM